MFPRFGRAKIEARTTKSVRGRVEEGESPPRPHPYPPLIFMPLPECLRTQNAEKKLFIYPGTLATQVNRLQIYYHRTICLCCCGRCCCCCCCCSCCTIKFASIIFSMAFSFSSSSIFLAIDRSLRRFASRDFFADMLFLERFLQYLSSLNSSGTEHLPRFHSLSEPGSLLWHWVTKLALSGLFIFCCGKEWEKLLPDEAASGWGNKTCLVAAGLEKATAALTSKSKLVFLYFIILHGCSCIDTFGTLICVGSGLVCWDESRVSSHSKADETMSSLVSSGVSWKSNCCWLRLLRWTP